VHSGNIDDIRKCFVEPYNGVSTTRKMIWHKYSDYTRELYARIKIPFKQMHFGSFISKKKSPTDIDIINIIHYTKAPLVKDMQGEVIQDRYATDALMIPIFEESHPSYKASQMLLQKKITYGLFDDIKQERRSMVEVDINYETA